MLESDGECGDGGAATSDNLYYPNAVVVNAAGDLYIADRKDNRIRKVAFATGYVHDGCGQRYGVRELDVSLW